MYSNGQWFDNATEVSGLQNQNIAFAVVVVQDPLSANGVKTKNLTFHGAIPNPATDQANIRISLGQSATVTINGYDASGRKVASILPGKLAAGEHLLPLNTASFSNGTYMYSVVTSAGEAIGSQLVIDRK